MAARIHIGRLLETFLELIRRHFGVLAGATVGLAVVDTALVLILGETGAQLISSVLSIAVVFLVLRYVLRAQGLVREEGGFGSYFGAAILSGLGMIVGLVFLIIPGLYLAARWSVAPALVITHRYRATEALGASWDATQASAWKLVLVFVVAFTVMICGIVAFGVVAGMADAAEQTPVVVAMTQLLSDLAVVAGPFLTVAIYKQIVGALEEFESVFG